MKYTAGTRQTLLDVAVITSGNVESVIDLAIANDMAITDDIVNGQVMETVAVARPDVVKNFKVLGVTPATGISSQVQEEMQHGGIGYMAIELNFIVS